MSDWTVNLEFEEGTSSKFWRARVEGKTLYVNYGKIGSNGQTQVKELGDPGAAKAEYEKLVREKRKKGYTESGGGGAKDAGDEAEEDEADGEEAEEEEEEERPAKKPAAKAAAPAKSAPAPAAKPAPAAAAPSVPGHRLILDAGNRKVETTLYHDGNTVRMDTRETYTTPEAAKKAFERLQKMLAGEGHKPA
jgi:predicted DNA-binding WGR domain protein